MARHEEVIYEELNWTTIAFHPTTAPYASGVIYRAYYKLALCCSIVIMQYYHYNCNIYSPHCYEAISRMEIMPTYTGTHIHTIL